MARRRRRRVRRASRVYSSPRESEKIGSDYSKGRSIL